MIKLNLNFGKVIMWKVQNFIFSDKGMAARKQSAERCSERQSPSAAGMDTLFLLLPIIKFSLCRRTESKMQRMINFLDGITVKLSTA